MKLIIYLFRATFKTLILLYKTLIQIYPNVNFNDEKTNTLHMAKQTRQSHLGQGFLTLALPPFWAKSILAGWGWGDLEGEFSQALRCLAASLDSSTH